MSLGGRTKHFVLGLSVGFPVQEEWKLHCWESLVILLLS